MGDAVRDYPPHRRLEPSLDPPPTHFTVTLAERQLLQMLVPHIHAPISTPDYEVRHWYEQWRCLQQLMANRADADRVAATATVPWQQQLPHDMASVGPNPSYPHRTGNTPRTPATPVPLHPGQDVADAIWEAAASSQGDRPSVSDIAERLRNPPALRKGHSLQHTTYRAMVPRRPTNIGKGGPYPYWHHTRSYLWKGGYDDHEPEDPDSSPMPWGSRPSFNARALGSMLGRRSP